MTNYSEVDLWKMKKADLASIILENGINIDTNSGKQQLIDAILYAQEHEGETPEEAQAALEARKRELDQLNYEHELSKRMGNRQAATYSQELARRRGAGAHVTGADAVALELQRRRKAYGGK